MADEELDYPGIGAGARNQSEPDEDRGFQCRRCGCRDLRVARTHKLPRGRIRRERYCRHCGYRMLTLEKEQGA